MGDPFTDPQAALLEAEREFAIGNFTAVDLWCQTLRAPGIAQPGADALLIRLMERLRLANDGWKWRQEGAAPGGKRYLLIKAWGEGFWSDMFHVVGCLLLSEITG